MKIDKLPPELEALISGPLLQDIKAQAWAEFLAGHPPSVASLITMNPFVRRAFDSVWALIPDLVRGMMKGQAESGPEVLLEVLKAAKAKGMTVDDIIAKLESSAKEQATHG